jgi:hypothetical protein
LALAGVIIGVSPVLFMGYKVFMEWVADVDELPEGDAEPASQSGE